MNNTVEAQHYTSDFYTQIQNRSKQSARIVLPYLFNYFRPKSVIDVGCGTGDWLSVFKENGIEDITGVDGEYVDRKMLQIPENNFVSYDLKSQYNSGKKYDLAMSVEVGEHLPDTLADNLVDSLCNHADIIMFSAAIPGQGGTYHINEQPHEYWINKFEKRGYETYDFLREQIWFEPYVECWYRQNILLFIKPSAIARITDKDGRVKKGYNKHLPSVHPELKFAQQKNTGFINSFIQEPAYSFKKYINIFKNKLK